MESLKLDCSSFSHGIKHKLLGSPPNSHSDVSRYRLRMLNRLTNVKYRELSKKNTTLPTRATRRKTSWRIAAREKHSETQTPAHSKKHCESRSVFRQKLPTRYVSKTKIPRRSKSHKLAYNRSENYRMKKNEWSLAQPTHVRHSKGNEQNYGNTEYTARGLANDS